MKRTKVVFVLLIVVALLFVVGCPPQTEVTTGKWETISRYCYRTPTPEGWLVKFGDRSTTGKSVCYVPDPKHEWVNPE